MGVRLRQFYRRGKTALVQSGAVGILQRYRSGDRLVFRHVPPVSRRGDPGGGSPRLVDRAKFSFQRLIRARPCFDELDEPLELLHLGVDAGIDLRCNRPQFVLRNRARPEDQRLVWALGKG